MEGKNKIRVSTILLITLALALVGIVLATILHHSDSEANTPTDRWEYGSCGKPEGKIVVLSIYADSADVTWTDSSEDELRKDVMRERLLTGTKWISDQASKYGKTVEFICDWEKDSNLQISTNMEADLTFISDTNKEEILDNIQNEASEYGSKLIEKYNADGIIYAYMLNIPEEMGKFSSVAMPYRGSDDENVEASDVNVDAGTDVDTAEHVDANAIPYDRNEAIILGYTTWGIDCYPAIYAHEILHLFGAPDFYDIDKHGNNYGTNEESVKWFEENNANDIMFEMYNIGEDGLPKEEIVQEITDATAYYIGWLEEWPLQSELGLAENKY